jgi:hypothetical protein
MQAKHTMCYKVTEEPRQLDVEKLYTNDKNARQQEFLVENEVDLSRLNSLRICCYDEFQRDMLCEAIKDSPLVNRVEVDESLYIRQNRELTFNVDSTHVEISTDSLDDYVYKVIYEDTIPDVLNPGNIVWEGRNEIRSCFRDASNVIELEYDKATDTWIEKNINPHIKQIDHDIEEINNNIDTANEHYVKLSNLLQRVRKLISNIQTAV